MNSWNQLRFKINPRSTPRRFCIVATMLQHDFLQTLPIFSMVSEKHIIDSVCLQCFLQNHIEWIHLFCYTWARIEFTIFGLYFLVTSRTTQEDTQPAFIATALLKSREPQRSTPAVGLLYQFVTRLTQNSTACVLASDQTRGFMSSLLRLDIL